MSESVDNKASEPVADAAGAAIAAPVRKWYVAIVKNNTEKASAARLAQLGYETYVASQTVTRVWRNGRKAKVDAIVLKAMVFVRCTETERRKEVVLEPYVQRFLTNRTAKSDSALSSPVAVVTDLEIDTLRFMLGQTDIPVHIENVRYRHGDKVRVARGGLLGLEGEIIDVCDGKGTLVIALPTLGNATLQIETINVEPAK